MNRSRLLALLVCLSLLAAACGSSDDATDAEAVSIVEPASGNESDSDSMSDSDDDSAQSSGGLDAEATTEAAEEESAGSAMESDDQDEAMTDAPDAQQSDSSRDSAELRSEAPATTVAPQPATAADQAEGGFFGTTVPEPEDNTFADYGVRPFVSTDVDPLSTFALDVDTASYSVARQWLESGAVPPVESVRVEEYLNSFDYDYIAPRDGLNVQADGGPSPYDPANVIVRVGVQAERVANADRPDAALTFVVDTSGSMDRSNRLALVKTSLTRLTEELESRDTVSIVTYSGEAQILLPPTSVRDEDLIFEAIDRLAPTGSTNLEAGLIAGYEMANESFQSDGINRVVLASDGVANVGLTDPDALARLIRDDADRGIQLVTVGVGMGNFNDVVMEQLADQGDGFYAYVNDEQEAEKLFSDDLVSTLLTVAIDGKIQVEFNDEVVDRYRLIGFENRAVLDSDFRNDAVDAGELGAGHQVTALYELTLRSGVGNSDQLGTVQLRWEDPEERSVRETRLVITTAMIEDRWNDTDHDFRVAVTAAAFAELLRDSPHTGEVTLSQVADEATALSPGSGAIEELAKLANEADRLS